MKRTPIRRYSAFTLIELLASIAILALLMSIIFGVFTQASKAWTLSEARTETFQAARLVMENMGREIESITVKTNTVSGNRTFIKLIDQSTGYVTGNANVLITPPNDILFFVGHTIDSTTANFADLTEFGYIPVYCQSSAITMQGGAYYLLRHQCRNKTPSGAANASWDFWDPADVGDWWTTPAMNTDAKTPILDNVLRFYVGFEVPDPLNTTNGTKLVSTLPAADTLPRAIHIRMSVLDRRYAARLIAVSGGPLTQLQLADVPVNQCGSPPCATIESSTQLTAPQKSILKDGLRTFYRTVYLRTGS